MIIKKIIAVVLAIFFLTIIFFAFQYKDVMFGEKVNISPIEDKKNEITKLPTISSIIKGNNGKTQIRGQATEDWLFEGQVSAELIQAGDSVDKFTCFAEGKWSTEETMTFLCETDYKIIDNSFSLKLLKGGEDTGDSNVNTVILPLSKM